MTCINCKYQWCWLCEGEYKYGHYDSGKCQGQQFTKLINHKKLKIITIIIEIIIEIMEIVISDFIKFSNVFVQIELYLFII